MASSSVTAKRWQPKLRSHCRHPTDALPRHAATPVAPDGIKYVVVDHKGVEQACVLT